METADTWLVIIHGEAEGKEVRVALDFPSAETILSPTNLVVGPSFISQIMDLLQDNEDWLIKTVIEEVRTPSKDKLPPGIPLFVLLTKSRLRGLSAGALFIAEEAALHLEEFIENPPDFTSSELNLSQRFIVSGFSPVGFAAACAEDSRLFTRFISRLLKRPEAFTEVSLLLPRWFHSVNTSQH
ncbi:MAG: hypothetical protein ACFFD8_04200 [Candidatus Thorarchaeota archaeon]